MSSPTRAWLCHRASAAMGGELKSTGDERRQGRSLVWNCRGLYSNLTVWMLVLYVCRSVSAGPVMLTDYMRGPVTLARNIRHLPCISRRTGQEGVCMFAIDCLKSNGTHLGTCIDRFYFGSCCQIADKTMIPHIDNNNIEDNTIDSASFVHPQTDDKLTSNVNQIPNILATRKTTTTEKAEVTTDKTTVTPKTTANVESKIDLTTLDTRLETKTTVAQTKEQPDVKPEATTEFLKLSTFQTVSVDSSSQVTEQLTKEPTTLPPLLSTMTTISSEAQTTTQKPIKKPTRPTPKPRPTYRPTNTFRPYSTSKPYNVSKPTRPPALNITRKPIYRPPPKRPTTTKKPLPIPPRLNITIIPQQTSTRPIFTRPQMTIITYINTTVSTVISTEEPFTESPTTTTSPDISSTTQEATSKPLDERTESLAPVTVTTTTESYRPLSTEAATEKATLSSTTEEVSSFGSSEFPPGLVTWSNTADPVTRGPEVNVTEVTTTEIWSPITPPEGWVLISTLSPKPESLSTSTESTQTNPPPTTSQPTTTTTTTTSQPTTTTSQPTTTPQTTTTPEPTTTTTTPQPTTTTHPTTTAEPTTPQQTTQKATQHTTTEYVATTNDEITTTDQATTQTEAKTTETAPPTEVTEVRDELTTIQATFETEDTTKPQPTTSQPSTSQPTTSQQTTSQHTTSQQTTSQQTTSQQTTSQQTTLQQTTSQQTTSLPTTTSERPEFTVNVTLSPPEAAGASVTNATEAGTTAATEATVATSASVNTTDGVTEVPYNITNYREVCGRRLWPEARIVGGAKAAFGRWPWQISLRQWRTSTYLHKCGAALLNENWAITAAHCVEHVPPSELLVRLGEHDLATEAEPYGFAERRVQIVASHPHFDPATFEYDLALLRFYEPVNFQPNILPVCVPDNDESFVGKTAHVTGWGRLYDEGPLPSVLQEVEVPIINNTACEAMYQAAGYNEHIPNIFICAGWKRGGSDSCEGDSGGPMVVQRDRDKRFVLGGVISWGIGCAEPNQPGVYTRISEFRDWINQILQF